MRSFLLACFYCLAALSASAQDTILRTDGDEVKARVLSITPTDITYIPITEPPSTDTLRLAATDVFLIRYANGTKEIVTSSATAAPAVGLGRTAQEMNNLGRMDARRYFKAPGAFWGTAGATFVSISAFGIGGVATGVAIAASPPKRHNMITTDQALLNDPNYLDGYQKQAQRKKWGSAAGGFGTGLATGVVVGFVALMVAFGAH
ncbi:hypothetical protein ACW9KT_02500 [Hymenobacter sp. HD11105]